MVRIRAALLLTLLLPLSLLLLTTATPSAAAGDNEAAFTAFTVWCRDHLLDPRFTDEKQENASYPGRWCRFGGKNLCSVAAYDLTKDADGFKARVNAKLGDSAAAEREGGDVGFCVGGIEWMSGGYKFYIMLSCFQYDDAVLSAVRQKIYDRGATVLWCYAPGFIHEGKADIANMEPLTGFRFAMSTEPSSPRINITDFTHPFFVGETALTSFGVKYSISPLFYVADSKAQVLGTYQGTGLPSLAVKKVGEATSIFCGSNKLTTPLIRGIAREAGVHLYSCSGDPFEANDRFALLHTSTGGDKTISLRAPADVVDVFTGEIVAANAARFTVNVPAEQTRFWFIGDAKDFPRERASGS